MPKQALIRFAEIAQGFDDYERLKLILFASDVKPSTYVVLKIAMNNLTEKYRFEERLRDLGVVFVESRMRAYEEIDRISKNKVIWKIKGVWIGYDLFHDRKGLKMFKKYVTYVGKQKHKRADLSGGNLYGYPECCIKSYIQEQDLDYLKSKYSYEDYYKRLHDVERKMPFIMHTPCSADCKKSARLNEKYMAAVKKYAPHFYRKFSMKKTYNTDLIVDVPSDILKDGESIWPVKTAFEYSVIASKRFEGHNYIYTYFTKKFYDFGAVLNADVTMSHNYADIKVNKVKKEIKNLMHIRKFLVVGRGF